MLSEITWLASIRREEIINAFHYLGALTTWLKKMTTRRKAINSKGIP